MRFDLEQALAHIRALDHPRAPGSVEELRAADFMAAQFAKLRWHVERSEATFSRFPELVFERIGWVAIGLAISAQSALASVGAGAGSSAGWLACEALALFCWLSAMLPRLRFGQRLPPKSAARIVRATWPIDPPPPARLVFLADLDSERPHWPRQWRQALAWIVLSLVMILSAANLGAALHLPRSARIGLLVALWILVVVQAADGLLPRGTGEEPDNRSGLAALIALASTLPRSVKERVAIEFIAAGAHAVDLADSVGAPPAARPTIFVRLIEPEPQKVLILVGQGPALALAEAAAQGLWIPHRVQRLGWFSGGFDTKPTRLEGASFVCLIGDTAVDRERLFPARGREPVEDEHASLARSVQLATEVALRWARLHGQTEPGASLERSAQKPG